MMSGPSRVTQTKGEVSLLAGRIAARTPSIAAPSVGALPEAVKAATALVLRPPLQLGPCQTPWT